MDFQTPLTHDSIDILRDQAWWSVCNQSTPRKYGLKCFALLFRAGAEVPADRYDGRISSDPYLRRVRAAGGFPNYERAHLAALAASANACGKAGAEKNDIIGPAFACRLGEHLPVGPALMLVKGDADPGLVPPAGKPRRDHPRIVDHKHIPRAQKRRQVTHDPVVDGIALEIEKPCRMARSRRFCGNRLGRQFIIEI